MKEQSTQVKSDAGSEMEDRKDVEKVVHKPELNLRSSFILAAAFFAMFITVGLMNAFGVFVQYYTQEYLADKSEFQISWIGSFAIFMMFAMGPLAGFVNDRFGPTVTLAIGGVCEIIALFMLSLSREYYQFFLTQGLLLGAGFAFITLPATATLPYYFVRNRAAAQGLVIAGSSFGGILWPIALDQMLKTDHLGFGWTIRVVAFVALALWAFVIATLRRPKTIAPAAQQPNPQTRDEEAVSGSLEPSEAEKSQAPPKKQSDLARLRHPSFILLCAGLAVAYFGFFVPFFFISTYAVKIGTSESFAFYLVSILNAASFFGRVLPGFVADRVGHFNVLTFSMFGSSIVVFCWTAANTTAGLVVWTLAFGFISGAILSLQFAAVSIIATREIMGMAFGALMASISITALVGTPIAGELVKRGYLDLSIYAAVMLFAGAVLVLCARLSRSRELFVKV